MTNSYSLDQYVHDLRIITAEETDPVRITDRVAPVCTENLNPNVVVMKSAKDRV